MAPCLAPQTGGGKFVYDTSLGEIRLESDASTSVYVFVTYCSLKVKQKGVLAILFLEQGQVIYDTIACASSGAINKGGQIRMWHTAL